jgi:hypothetical protein
MTLDDLTALSATLAAMTPGPLKIRPYVAHCECDDFDSALDRDPWRESHLGHDSAVVWYAVYDAADNEVAQFATMEVGDEPNANGLVALANNRDALIALAREALANRAVAARVAALEEALTEACSTVSAMADHIHASATHAQVRQWANERKAEAHKWRVAIAKEQG